MTSFHNASGGGRCGLAFVRGGERFRESASTYRRRGRNCAKNVFLRGRGGQRNPVWAGGVNTKGAYEKKRDSTSVKRKRKKLSERNPYKKERKTFPKRSSRSLVVYRGGGA